MKIRNREIHVLFTPEELAALHRKMDEIGVKNRSAFIRKMSLDGYVVHLDTSDIQEMIRLLRQSSNNLNQLTRRVHETGRFYDADLESLRQDYDRLWDATGVIVSKLARLK